MSFCAFLISRILILCAILLIIAFLPNLPPDMEFTSFSVTPPRNLEGALAINEKLNGAEHLFKGQIKNPKGFAVANKTLYTGIQGGDIIKIIGDNFMTVASIIHPCEGTWDEKKCGRLLGMEFDKHGMLYVADAYYGIYKVNIHSGKVMHIIQTKKPIEGKLAKLANGVTVAPDGNVYWTTSSCDVYFDDAGLIMFGDASGRLFKYDPIKKTNTLLLDKIHFAKGVALSKNGDFLVVSETVRSRLLRYWLSGPKKGTSEVFVDGLPGMPDNVRRNNKGGFFVPIVIPRTTSVPTLSDLIAPYPLVRRLVARVICLMEVPFELLHRAYPNYYTGVITHWIGHLESMTAVYPQGLIVVELSETGEIVGSLHSTDNKVAFVSDFVVIDHTYYLGSPFNNFLGRVKTKPTKK